MGGRNRMLERGSWIMTFGGAATVLACQGPIESRAELAQEVQGAHRDASLQGESAEASRGRKYCDPRAPRSLDGQCNNLAWPELGAVGAPFVYLAGQHYRRGANDALYFMRERPVAEGEPNAFPYTPSASAPVGTCGPDGYVPACRYTVETVEVAGFGQRTKYNARALSNALHGVDAPYAQPEPRIDPTGVTHFATRLSAFLAHDVQQLQASVTLRRTRQGFPDQSDPTNPTVVTGVPVLDPADLFNTSTVYTPAGVPEAPTFRTMIVSASLPQRTWDHGKPALEFDNSSTPFVDGDMIYGHNELELRKLRSGRGGRFALKDLISPQVGPIPPLAIHDLPPSFAETGLHVDAQVDGQEAFSPSFRDDRNLSTIGVASVTWLWVRFHNVMAERCAEAHPEWSTTTSAGDDQLFECARAWTLAIYQHIVFDDFIPALTGRPLPRYRGYQPGLEPQATFESVLGPLSLHSTPSELVPIAKVDGSIDTRMQLQLGPGQPLPPAGYFPFIGSIFPTPAASPAFYWAMAGIPTPQGNPTNPATPWQLVEDPLSQIIRGLSFFAQEPNDLTVIDSQRNIPANYGLDLIANNAFRSQQLGVANYYEIRRRLYPGRERDVYGQPGCPSWLENADQVDDPAACFKVVTGDATLAAQVRERLQTPLLGVAAKVKNLPVFTGVVMEPKLGNGMFGYTGRALIEDQFVRARDADRFYYRNQFSRSEEAQVDEYTMAKVIRAVLGDTVGVQDDVFHLPPPGFFH